MIRRHHLLLVTLLLANSVAMETLPLFLDRLVPSWAAVLVSVTAILLFGEVSLLVMNDSPTSSFCRSYLRQSVQGRINLKLLRSVLLRKRSVFDF